EERLGVEAEVAEPGGLDPARAQAVRDRVRRKAGIVLLPREALLLRRGHDLAVAHQAGRRVVVVGRDAEDELLLVARRVDRLALALDPVARLPVRERAVERVTPH